MTGPWAPGKRAIEVMSREELEQEALALFAGIGLAEQTAQCVPPRADMPSLQTHPSRRPAHSPGGVTSHTSFTACPRQCLQASDREAQVPPGLGRSDQRGGRRRRLPQGSGRSALHHSQQGGEAISWTASLCAETCKVVYQHRFGSPVTLPSPCSALLWSAHLPALPAVSSQCADAPGGAASPDHQREGQKQCTAGWCNRVPGQGDLGAGWWWVGGVGCAWGWLLVGGPARARVGRGNITQPACKAASPGALPQLCKFASLSG